MGMRLLFVTISLLISLGAMAQSGVYAGGAGDGHAMGELVFKQVGMDELAAHVTVYPTIIGESQPVQISSAWGHPLRWRLVNVSGLELFSGDLITKATIDVQQLPAGFYILFITGEQGTTSYKLNKVQ